MRSLFSTAAQVCFFCSTLVTLRKFAIENTFANVCLVSRCAYACATAVPPPRARGGTTESTSQRPVNYRDRQGRSRALITPLALSLSGRAQGVPSRNHLVETQSFGLSYVSIVLSPSVTSPSDEREACPPLPAAPGAPFLLQPSRLLLPRTGRHPREGVRQMKEQGRSSALRCLLL